MAQDALDLKIYQDLLQLRELQRLREEAERKATMAAKEKVAQARHEKASAAGEEDERRAVIVQRQQQAKIGTPVQKLARYEMYLLLYRVA